MTKSDVAEGLLALRTEAQVQEQMDAIVRDWMASNVGIEAVEPVFRLFEAHPDWDFGMPGAFVHFVEKLYKKGYEAKLVESLHRAPTPHTLWMLNRLINGEKSVGQRREYIELMAKVARESRDEEVRQEAAHFASLQPVP